VRWCKLLYVFGVLCASFLLFSSGAYAAPATFTVTNTDDSGVGSLRQAIDDANNNGNPSDMDVIEFTIPGSGVHTLTPQSVLPNVSEKLTIDGYTQPGTQQNSAVAPNPLNNVIKIELDLGSIPSSNRDKLTITADGSEIRGLALFSDTVGRMIRVNANNFVFQGNYNGFRADGMTHVEAPIDFDAVESLSLMMLSESYSGCTIGGTNPQDRNIFGIQPGSLAAGTVTTYSNCSLKGNYFGLAKDGVTTFSRSM